jgi:hypothetical protein
MRGNPASKLVSCGPLAVVALGTVVALWPGDASAKPEKLSLGGICNRDAECVSERCRNGQCVPQDGQGRLREFCNDGRQCASGDCGIDVPGTMPKTNMCQAPMGGACTANQDCVSLRCDKGAGNARRCIPNDGTGKPGDYCTHDHQCAAPNCVQNRCVAAARTGQPCATNASCASGRCDTAAANLKLCIPNDGTGAVGDYCSHNNQCANRNCVDQGCRAKVGLGKDCVTNASCESNRCDMGAGNPRKCIPNDRTGGVGDYCTHNNQCQPGRACALENGKRFGACR